jgi:hypothetical protein
MDTQEVTVGGVRVVNSNDFTIADRFDGVPYTFETGKAQTLPPDAANHIFGWRPLGEDERQSELDAEMLVYCQKRHGWNTPEVIRADNHTKWFGKLEFKPVRFRMVEVSEDETDLPSATQSPRAPRPNKLMEAADQAEARRANPR